MQSLPPLFSTIHDQTGIAPPNWMVQMPKTAQQNSTTAPNDIKHKAQMNSTN